MSPVYRKALKLSRLLHLYLTLFGMALILLFAITGFMLNHEDWFLPTEPRIHTVKATISSSLLNPVDKFALCEALRQEFKINGAVNTFRAEEDGVEIEFLRPGQRTVVEIKRDSAEATATWETKGWAGVVTDLHKGKSAGKLWGIVIDAVCILLLVIAITGLLLWSSLKTRGKKGAIALLLGTLSAFAIYYWGVP